MCNIFTKNGNCFSSVLRKKSSDMSYIDFNEMNTGQSIHPNIPSEKAGGKNCLICENFKKESLGE